jgi:ubiquinone/menaquinone biosynthesis C-methylase UbiE
VGDTYTHGHHQSVLRSHSWRTAANSAAYLIDHLTPGLDLLDVGCGPGTITLDLADRVAPGRVVGIDASADVIEQARRLPTARVEFELGNVYDLQFGDAAFDVVHAHQVLQHLSEPVAALTEMRRVLRPQGLLAVRDGDYPAFLWRPDSPELDRWLDLYMRVTAQNQAHADAGRYLPGWVRAAGFEDLVASSSTWTFADPDSRAWWGETWAERVEGSALAEQALEYGLATNDELTWIADGWRRWAQETDALFVVVHVEVLARAPAAT